MEIHTTDMIHEHTTGGADKQGITEVGTGCALDVGQRASGPEWDASQSGELIQGFRGGCLRDLQSSCFIVFVRWLNYHHFGGHSYSLTLYFSVSLS